MTILIRGCIVMCRYVLLQGQFWHGYVFYRDNFDTGTFCLGTFCYWEVLFNSAQWCYLNLSMNVAGPVFSMLLRPLCTPPGPPPPILINGPVSAATTTNRPATISIGIGQVPSTKDYSWDKDWQGVFLLLSTGLWPDSWSSLYGQKVMDSTYSNISGQEYSCIVMSFCPYRRDQLLVQWPEPDSLNAKWLHPI